MSAVWFRARAELRARWRPWLAIALLLGVFGGATAAVAAGARRTDSAYPRFLEQARAFDVFLGDFSAFAPDLFWKPDFDAIERSPLIESSARAHFFFGFEDDEVLAPLDDAYGTIINRPKMLAGRMPRAVDEVSMPFAWERNVTPSVGEEVTLRFDEGAEVTLTVVGIHAMPGDFPPTDMHGESFIASPAFAERYMGKLPGTGAAFYRLADGATPADLDELIRGIAGGKLANTYRNEDQASNVLRSFDLQATALWLLVAGLGVGTVLVMGQSIARQASMDTVDRNTLLWLGMSRGQVAMTTLIRSGLAGLLAGAIAVGIAVAASPLFPRGLPRVAEPATGPTVDLPVLLVTLGSLMVLCLVAAVRPALRGAQPAVLPAKPSLAARVAARSGFSPSSVAGVRFALEPGRGQGAVPVRSTITTVALGLAAVTAAFTFASNMDALLTSPHLYGRGWNHEYGFGGDFSAVPDSALEAAREDPTVEAAASGTLGLIFDVHGDDQVLPVTGIALAEQVKGSILAEPTAGRYPARGEVVLGPRTMKLLDVRMGDEIRIGLQGSDAHPLRVVGEVIMPPLAEQSQFGDGVFIHYDTLVQQLAPLELDQVPPPDQLLVRFSDAQPLEEAVSAFRGKLDDVDQDFRILEAADLVNFGRIQNLPLVLAALLGLLSAGALTHVLMTAIRRRRREVAILKTLGFDRGQARASIRWQASTVAVVALLIGIPLGVAGGRVLWSLFASRSYIIIEHALPLTALALIAPGAIVLANLISLVPSRAAATAPPALILRTE